MEKRLSNKIKSKEKTTLLKMRILFQMIKTLLKPSTNFDLKYFPKPKSKFLVHLKLIQCSNELINFPNTLAQYCLFSFKFETQEKFTKLIQNLNCNEATQQFDIPIKILKENSGISPYILYHNFNNSLYLVKFSLTA